MLEMAKMSKVAQSIKPDKGIAPVFPSSHLLWAFFLLNKLLNIFVRQLLLSCKPPEVSWVVPDGWLEHQPFSNYIKSISLCPKILFQLRVPILMFELQRFLIFTFFWVLSCIAFAHLKYLTSFVWSRYHLNFNE